MALLARAGFLLGQPMVNLACVWIKLGPPDRCRSPIPRWLAIRQYLRNTVSADPEIPSNLTPTQPVLKVSVTNFQIQIHPSQRCKHCLPGQRVDIPRPSRKPKGQKWSTFTPPATPQRRRYRGRVLLRRSHFLGWLEKRTLQRAYFRALLLVDRLLAPCYNLRQLAAFY